MNAEAYQNEMSEAWEKVGKAVNTATEQYLRELDSYLGWVVNVRREVLEQSLATTRELSRIGESQVSFFLRLQKNLPYFGMPQVDFETKNPKSPSTENAASRAT